MTFKVKKSAIKYFDGDTVSCLANLSHLKQTEKDAIKFDKEGREFNGQKSVDRLLQFIKAEKPHFRHEIRPDDLRSIVCVKPKKNNNRIVAQSGAFLLFGLVSEFDPKAAVGIKIARTAINAFRKNDILSELDKFGINEGTMFPEIESVARYLRARPEGS